MTYNIIATVLKTGGAYTVDYVNRLANAVNRHLTLPYQFVVLTDTMVGYNENVHKIVPLKCNLPGWWSKVELHRPDFYPGHQITFFDLDTLILDNIDDIVGYKHEFSTLEDFYSPGSVASGVMAWEQLPAREYYNQFMANPEHAMRITTRGDQEWLEGVACRPAMLQHLFPNAFVSFKKHCTRSSKDITVPKGAKVLCFHGTPKPHEALQYNTIKENWK